jgi:prepilin-type N-terminal cleavage/methylation domain-containing protein
MLPRLFIMPEKLRVVSHKGFTLVEILLGLSITAIIGLSVCNLFWSGMKLDDRLKRLHENYLEVLMANQSMTKDLENAIYLDLSTSYPDQKAFEGKKNELAFLVPTESGIKRVRYYSGTLDWGRVTKTIVGKKVGHLSKITLNQTDALPIEFLLREEMDLSDWLNETKDKSTTQIVAAGLKKGTFNCQYAAFDKDLKKLSYLDHWDNRKLPAAVSCNINIYNAEKPQADNIFKRDMFLAPVGLGYENE